MKDCDFDDRYEDVIINGRLVAAIWMDLEDEDWNIEILAGEEKGLSYSCIDSREEALELAAEMSA